MLARCIARWLRDEEATPKAAPHMCHDMGELRSPQSLKAMPSELRISRSNPAVKGTLKQLMAPRRSLELCAMTKCPIQERVRGMSAADPLAFLLGVTYSVEFGQKSSRPQVRYIVLLGCGPWCRARKSRFCHWRLQCSSCRLSRS